MKLNLLSLVLLLIFLTFACSHKPDKNLPNPDDDQNGSENAISLVQDPLFERGLVLRGVNANAAQNDQFIYPFGGAGNRPAWMLSEWTSKYPISKNELMKQSGGVKYENPGKLVSFQQEETTTLINMDVTASNEYDHPRMHDEFWIHLLLEQEFGIKPSLTEIDQLILTFEGRLTHEQLQMHGNTFDPGLHTAQFQLYLTIQDLNKQSPGYGDFLWFGVPFYDYRYEQISQSDAPDPGTGKYIYGIGTEPFTNKSFKSGEWIKIKLDLKPFILQGLKVARDHNYLKKSADRSFKVSGFNLGWEVPGTIDVGFEFRNFDVQYIPAR